MKHRTLRIVRCGRWLPAFVALYQVGCLPENAFQETFAQNFVLTSAIIVQSITALIFNTFLPFI